NLKGTSATGLDGADKKCNDAAKAVPKLAGHTFRAWLSDTNSAARSRLPQGTKPYQLVNGDPIATSFTDIVDGTLAKAILLDEKGSSIQGDPKGTFVWTGTTYDGNSDPLENCSDWTTDGFTDTPEDRGVVGDATQTTANWTESDGPNCDQAAHLYC